MTGLVVAALLAACAEPKPPNAFEEAFNDDTKPWVEVEAQLPPKPADADLIGFAVSGATSYRFGIDSKSLSIGTDGVYRYTLVAISAQGARNVTYEGIRCATDERKIYAIGRPDGNWARARNAAWTKIEEVGNNRQHAALEKEYFCPESYGARNTKEIIDRMKIRSPSSEGSFARDASGLKGN
jgi:hypothetical protein